jgi:hypothetical protein
MVLWQIDIVGGLFLANSTECKVGGDYFTRRKGAEARKRYLIRQLEAMDQKVTLQPVA